MNDMTRPGVPAPTRLLMHILDQPGVVAAVRELPGAVLGKLIDRIGLEDAGELVALATTAQLERVFDDDLWRPRQAGGDETFRPERFALWLRVMSEAGDDALVQRLCELPQDLVALGVHRLAWVIDIDRLEEELSPGDEAAEALARALELSAVEEWEEFRIISREPDAWDDLWNALMALDRDHHERLRDLLTLCCDMTREYISGQGGLYQVLTAAEMLESDVAASRDDRRASEGFVRPADARAFLELARRGAGHDDERDPLTSAYFRDLQGKGAATVPSSRPDQATVPPGTQALRALLEAAEAWSQGDDGIALPRPVAALAALPGAGLELSHVVAPLFEQAMKDLREHDPACFDARVKEVGYLVNVWMAGGAHEGRRPGPNEAMDLVLSTVEGALRAGLPEGQPSDEAARALLEATPVDLLFRRGFAGAPRP
jgi:hypothetical protein